MAPAAPEPAAPTEPEAAREGDRTRATWLADHHDFFGRFLPTVGIDFDPHMATVFERFELLYGE